MATSRKKLSAIWWNKGADLFQALLTNPVPPDQQHEILMQAIEAYIQSLEIMYAGKKRLEILTEKYANNFFEALTNTHALHFQKDVAPLLKRKFAALTKLEKVLRMHKHDFTDLETKLYELVCVEISMCTAIKEIEGRLVRPEQYPPIENQEDINRSQWRQYVLSRAERGAAILPAIQENVRGKCKNSEIKKLAIIDNRMQMPCYKPIVDTLAIVFKDSEELALFQSQKQQAFRDFKNMHSRTELIVPPPAYTPSELHGLADSKKDVSHAIKCYSLALLDTTIREQEQRDIMIKLAGCFLKQNEYIEAMNYLKSAYLINFDLEENNEDSYSIYHARGKVILIELMHVIDIYCNHLRNLNEKNNYRGLKSQEGVNDQKIDPKNLLLDELNYNDTLPIHHNKQPTVSEYSYGCTFFATEIIPQEGLVLRDGNFNIANFAATKSKPNVHHYVAASVIQNSFSHSQLNEFVFKMSTQQLPPPKNVDERIEEVTTILKASTLKP